jgi:hypothetical protein
LLLLLLPRFAKKNDLPMLEHVTLPRVGALKVLVEELGPKAETANCLGKFP